MRPTLLIVDDDLETLRALCAALEPLGTTLAFSDGLSALAHLRTSRVDLLVSDLRLPDISGIDVIAGARVAQPELPALLITGRAEMSDLAEAINRAGVYRYLKKPVDLDDLFRTAQTALEAEHLRRERERLHQELARSHGAMRTLYEASRELSQAPGRAEIVAATLSHLARAVPFELCAMLVAPPESHKPTLYLQARAPVDEATLASFKERIVAEHAARSGRALREHEVRLILVGPQLAQGGRLPPTLHLLEASLEVGTLCFGTVQLLCGVALGAEDRRLVVMLANEAAQALRRVDLLVHAQARQLDLLLRSMADGIVMVGGADEVTLVNPAARAMLGLAAEGPVAAGFLAKILGFHPFDLSRTWEQSGAETVRRELELAGRTLHSLVSPVQDASGALAGVAVVLRDLTAEKELERRKEEFVSIVSHEMRTPLASIAGSLELLLRGYVGTLEDKQRHYLGLARDSCNRLHAVVDDLLDMAKYESGRLEVDFAEVDLGALLREAAEQYQGAAMERKVELHCAAEGFAPVAGDHARLFQVLNNLLSNALKFAPERGRIELALLTSEALSDHVGFTVWNSGGAVADDALEHMFEKFRQLPGVRRHIGGTGLGLPIARGLVESHGGRLWAQQGLGNGVRFAAVFPRLDGLPAAPVLDAGVVRALGDVQVAFGNEVVVGDPELATALLIHGALARYGVPAVTATGAEGVLAQTRARARALLVVDPRMGGADGSLLQILAHDPETRAVPVVVTAPAGCIVGVAPQGVSQPFRSAELLRAMSTAIAAEARGRPARALVVDPDAAAREALVGALAADGYEVAGFAEAERALSAALLRPPDLVVVEVSLGKAAGDGFELAQALRSSRGDGPGLLFVTHEGTLAQKVRAFREGAADFLVKPVDAAVLVERARGALARRDAQSATPTTGLPGGHAIDRELRRRIAAGEPYACLHITVDHLKEYGDAYGFGKAEGVVQQVGDLVREALFSCGAPSDFAGHVERDHFVVVTLPLRAEVIGERLAGALTRVLPLYYDKADRARGALEMRGSESDAPVTVPLMSPMVVAVLDSKGRFIEPSEIATAARIAKKRAQTVDAGAFVKDEPPA